MSIQEPPSPATHVPVEESGLNVRPGPEDDGWVNPAPVTLGDGTLAYLLKDGEGLRMAYEAIKNAKRRIGLEVYILRDDETGNAFTDLLCRKAREGVRVYAIVDAFGSDHRGRRMFKAMRRAGVRLAEFHPYRPWECRYSWRPWIRDHRKLLVIDDDIAGLGGLNIGDEYAARWVTPRAAMHYLMRDTAIGLIGPASRMLRESFARTWRYTQRGGPIHRPLYVGNLRMEASPKGRRIGKARRLEPMPQRPITIIDGPIGILASVPTLVSPLRPMLYSLFHNARSSIRMIMAYFAPDDEMIDELCSAARRGVRVQLIFGAMSDWGFMIVAARSFYRKLLEAGVEIYERQGAVLHAKMLTVDSRFSLIGSTNLDYRSIEQNLEIAAVIDDERFAGNANALLDHDIRYSTQMHVDDWKNPPWRDRLVQWTVSRMRYLL